MLKIEIDVLGNIQEANIDYMLNIDRNHTAIWNQLLFLADQKSALAIMEQNWQVDDVVLHMSVWGTLKFEYVSETMLSVFYKEFYRPGLNTLLSRLQKGLAVVISNKEFLDLAAGLRTENYSVLQECIGKIADAHLRYNLN